MSCQFCGALMERGALVCEACGAEQPEVGGRPRAAATAAVVAREPEQWVMEGPQCAEHPGMPLVGNCPRCQKQVCVRCAPDAARDNLTCTECEGLSPAHKLAPASSVCALHPDKRAVFICSRCGSFACVGCKPLNDRSGQCVKCTGTRGPMATRGDRFVANFVDNLAVFILPLIAVVIAAVVAPKGGGKSDQTLLLLMLGLGGLALFASFGAQLYAQVTWGQSIGKRLTGIKVVRMDGSPIELWRLILLRNLAINVLGQACAIVPLVDICMIFTQDQRCLHDYLADSVVIDVPTQEG